MRISDWSSDVCSSDLTVREVPGGTRELPSEALGLAGGGTIAVDPTDASGRKALNRIFLFDVSLPRALENIPFGTRVHVRLQLAWEPIGWQIARRVRPLFLSPFDPCACGPSRPRPPSVARAPPRRAPGDRAPCRAWPGGGGGMGWI